MKPLDAMQAERYRQGAYTPPALYHLLRCRRVVMLQGPMGTFFNRTAAWLQGQGVEVCKINFNGGDWLFHRHLDATDYRGTLAGFPAFLRAFLLERRIDGIVCFGDCRHYHKAAAHLARLLQLEFFAFEEGYIRPDYITLERGGVNMHSPLPRDPGFYRALPEVEVAAPAPARASFGRAGWCATAYYIAARLLHARYPYYRHHKAMSLRYETRTWVRAWLRKHLNRWRDAPVFERLVREQADRYFVVALQVFNDSQVTEHSPYGDVRDFIAEVLASFAAGAEPGAQLVFKHHPMDRGQRDYRRLIAALSRRHGVAGRVHYLHDVHLPTLLRHARGVVIINSTVGLSALYHHKPVMVMGHAVFALPGLTFQGRLAQFWTARVRVDRPLWRRFRAWLVTQTQLNGAFYGRDFHELLPACRHPASGRMAAPLAQPQPGTRPASGLRLVAAGRGRAKTAAPGSLATAERAH